MNRNVSTHLSFPGRAMSAVDTGDEGGALACPGEQRVAKIRESKRELNPNAGYARLFGSTPLGGLISSVHRTVIRSGNELERLIEAAIPRERQTTLDRVQQDKERFHAGTAPRTQVVFGHHLAQAGLVRGSTVDVIILDHEAQTAHVVEIKDGYTFDTKKSSGELASLMHAAEAVARLTGYRTIYAFCAFNQDDKDMIIKGSKGRFTLDTVMTGRELCALLGVDFEALRVRRQSDQADNLEYFIEELLHIPEARAKIVERLNRSGENGR